MSLSPDARAGPPLAPPIRSITVQFERLPLGLAWGASTAVACGILAARPWPADTTTLAAVIGAWFLAVPLCGAVWAPFLGRRETLAPAAEATLQATDDAGHVRHRSGAADRLRNLAARLAAEHWDALLALALGGSVATLLGPAVLALFGIAIAGFALAWLVRGQPPAARGAVRSSLEIALPGALTWLALGGPARVPAPLAAGNGEIENLALWWQLNWLFPVILAAFTLIHYAMTTVRRRSELAQRRRQLSAGYVAATAALALADQPLGAAAVALIFIIQWPFQAHFQTGRVRWHLQATQGLAMLAMLVAALAAD